MRQPSNRIERERRLAVALASPEERQRLRWADQQRAREELQSAQDQAREALASGNNPALRAASRRSARAAALLAATLDQARWLRYYGVSE
jgi:hypothetical protein